MLKVLQAFDRTTTAEIETGIPYTMRDRTQDKMILMRRSRPHRAVQTDCHTALFPMKLVPNPWQGGRSR
jgi:hypothetical protein